ncbi:hypothetical protein HHU12_13830 [Flammeovirga aprica JL-4]|uniref:Uncharacterized protein n=1 Tax=Flammeovirga aprica JL-4 TaxID=694437 RepID=A0A7X9RUP9_9BACT|nr:hypothetical protein [Flammeovirga aprica]NME69049.1 hypothetical protein [Flammeovirga aprica JL-4]
MLIRYPKGQIKGLEVEQLVSLIDIYPTLKDMCDLEDKSVIHSEAGPIGGHSMRQLLMDKQLEWKGLQGTLTVMGVGIYEPVKGLGILTNPQALWHIKIIKDLPKKYVLK